MHRSEVAEMRPVDVRAFRIPEPIRDAVRVRRPIMPRLARWSWLQRWASRRAEGLQRRLAGWILALGGEVPTESHERVEREVRRIPVDFDAILREVSRSKANLIRIWEKQARYVVIGRAQYHAIMSQAPHGLLEMEVPWNYDSRAYVTGRVQPKLFCGLTLVVCPWVDGVFLLPKLESK